MYLNVSIKSRYIRDHTLVVSLDFEMNLVTQVNILCESVWQLGALTWKSTRGSESRVDSGWMAALHCIWSFRHPLVPCAMNRLLTINIGRNLVRQCSTKGSQDLTEGLAVKSFPREVPSFSSPLCLSKLYPKSSLDAFTPPADLPQQVEPGKFNGFVPMDKLTITSERPSGQHLLKAQTKVCVSFHLASADWIPESARVQLSSLVSSIVFKWISCNFHIHFFFFFSIKIVLIKTAYGQLHQTKPEAPLSTLLIVWTSFDVI